MAVALPLVGSVLMLTAGASQALPPGGESAPSHVITASLTMSAAPQGATLVARHKVPFKVWGERPVGPWLREFGPGSGFSLIAWNTFTGRQLTWKVPPCPKRQRPAGSEASGEVVGDSLIGYITCTYRGTSGKGGDKHLLRVSRYDLGASRLAWSTQIPVSGDSSTLMESDGQWLIFANDKQSASSPSDLVTVNAHTGEHGPVTIKGLGQYHVAVQDGVLAVNEQYEPITGWSLSDGRQLWTVAEPEYPTELPNSYFNAYRGVWGTIVVDKWFGVERLTLDPQSGAVLTDNLPPFSMIDPYRPVAASTDAVVDTRTWRVSWYDPGLEIVFVCAGRVWTSEGEVLSAETGQVLARGERRTPTACVSESRTAYVVSRGNTDWVEVYQYPAR